MKWGFWRGVDTPFWIDPSSSNIVSKRRTHRTLWNRRVINWPSTIRWSVCTPWKDGLMAWRALWRSTSPISALTYCSTSLTVSLALKSWSISFFATWETHERMTSRTLPSVELAALECHAPESSELLRNSSKYFDSLFKCCTSLWKLFQSLNVGCWRLEDLSGDGYKSKI